VVPPKQKPTTPILPVHSGRAFSQAAEATKSSNILLSSTLLNSSPPFSSSPGYPPTEVRPSGANATKFAIPTNVAPHPLYMDSGHGFRESQAHRATFPFRLPDERNSLVYCHCPEARGRSRIPF